MSELNRIQHSLLILLCILLKWCIYSCRGVVISGTATFPSFTPIKFSKRVQRSNRVLNDEQNNFYRTNEYQEYTRTFSKRDTSSSVFDASNLGDSVKRDSLVKSDDAQKRTQLKEKEIQFYGSLVNLRHGTVNSNLKDDGDSLRTTHSKIEDVNFYGSKDNPAKSCRDIFLNNRNAKSGNFYIRTSDDELLMVTCGFPEVNETLVTEKKNQEKDQGNTKDGESYYGKERIAPSRPPLILPTTMQLNTSQYVVAEKPVARQKGSNETSNEFSEPLNPTGMPINFVLPNFTSKVVIKDEATEEEIKDLTKPINKVERKPKNPAGEGNKGEKDRKEFSGNGKKENKENTKQENGEKGAKDIGDFKEIKDENKKKEKEPEDKEESKDKNKHKTDSDETTKKPQPSEEKVNPTPATTTVFYNTNTIIPKMPTTEQPSSTKPLSHHQTKPTTKPLKSRTTSLSPTTRMAPTTTPTTSTTSTIIPPYNRPKDPELSPDLKLGGQIGREQYKDFESQKPKYPDKIDFPPVHSTPDANMNPERNTQLQNNYPMVPPFEYPIPQQPKMIGYGFNGSPKYDQRPEFNREPPPYSKFRYNQPQPWHGRPEYPGRFNNERTGFENRRPPQSLGSYNDIKFPDTPPEPHIADEDSKLQKSTSEENAGNAGDLGDIPEESKPLHITNTKPAVKVDSLFGRRDSRPDPNNTTETSYEPQRDRVASGSVRSVSWAFHEKVMNNEKTFNNQYTDFEEMDRRDNAKRKKEQERASKEKKLLEKQSNKQKDESKLNESPPPKETVTKTKDKAKNESAVKSDIEHSFSRQYHEFEDLDKHSVSRRNITNTLNQFTKSKDTTENAETRTWNINRLQMVKEVAKQQYDDFEKTPQQIEQDIATKTYNKQYDDFENFKNATANPNQENETQEESGSQNTKMGLNTLNGNGTVMASNNSANNQNNTSGKVAFTDYYKEYMDEINNGFEPQEDNNLPIFPNAPANFTVPSNSSNGITTVPQNISMIQPSTTNNINVKQMAKNYSSIPQTANINELVQLPIEPKFYTNAPAGVSQENATTSIINSTTVREINSTVAIVNNNNNNKADPIATAVQSFIDSLKSQGLQIQKTKNVAGTKREEGLNPEQLTQYKVKPIGSSSSRPTSQTTVRRQLFRQISGPPNPHIKQKIFLPTNNVKEQEDEGLKRTGVESLKLRNLTGHPEMIPKQSPNLDKVKFLKRLLVKNGVSLVDLNADQKMSLAKLLKSLEMYSDDITEGTEEKTNEEDRIKSLNFKTIPNAYNFIVPEARKFAVSEKDMEQERERVGERLISALQKSRNLEQKHRVELIKAQALSSKEPSMGHFTTADLKQFSYHGRSSKFQNIQQPNIAVRLGKGKSQPEAILFLMPSASENNEIKSSNLENNGEKFQLDTSKHSLFHKDLLQPKLENIAENFLFDKSIRTKNEYRTFQNSLPSFVFQRVSPTTTKNSIMGRQPSQFYQTLKPISRSQIKPWENKTLGKKIVNAMKSFEDQSLHKKSVAVETTQPLNVDLKSIKSIPKDFTENLKFSTRQNVTRINDGIFSAGLNMQDMITQAQKEMENIPGLTEENKKINETTDTTDEAMEKIKKEHEKTKAIVDKQVKQGNEENQKQVQQQVQENQPSNKKSLLQQQQQEQDPQQNHIINAEALPGMEKRSKIQRKSTQSDQQQTQNNTIPTAIQQTMDEIKKDQERIKQEVFKQVNASKGGSLLPHQEHVKQYESATKYIQDLANGPLPNITATPHTKLMSGIQKAYIYKKKSRRPKKKSNVHTRSPKLDKNQVSHTNRERHLTKKMSTHYIKPLSESALVKPFFEEESKAIDYSHVMFPEPLVRKFTPTGNRYSVQKEKKVNGNILGSAARSFRKYELDHHNTKKKKRVKRICKEERSFPYQELVKSLRGLIPSAIGQLSPSSDAMLPSPTKESTTVVQQSTTNDPTNEAQINEIINEVINHQHHINITKGSVVSNNGDSINEVPPVEQDGKPHVDSGPQEDERSELEKQEKRPASDSASGPGESGKDELGTNIASKMTGKMVDNTKKINKKEDKNNSDKTFEAGLKEAIDIEASPNADSSTADSNNGVATVKPSAIEESSNSDEGNIPDTSPQLKMEPQDDGVNSGISITQPVNVTALELGIIKLLNTTVKRPRVTTPHGKKMKELNHKYETLKLPVEHGELIEDDDDSNENLPTQKIAEALNRTRLLNEQLKQQQHRAAHPILPPPKIQEKELKPIKITEVVDATPTESGSFADSSNSALVDHTTTKTKQDDTGVTQASSIDVSPNIGKNLPDFIPETISIEIPKNEVEQTNSNHENSQNNGDNTQQQQLNDKMTDSEHQTPAELAKKISKVLLEVQSNKIKTQQQQNAANLQLDQQEQETTGQEESKQQPSGEKVSLSSTTPLTSKESTTSTANSKENQSVDLKDGNLSLPVTTLSENSGANSIPIIPIPMDSELGKILYPVLGNDSSLPTPINTVESEGKKFKNSSKVDGTDYSTLLIEQTRKLLRKNKLKRKDLINLLKASNVIRRDTPTRPEEQTNNKKNKINNDELAVGIQPTVRTIVRSKNKSDNTIHISLKRQNGYLLLEPDKNEAYEKKLVPHVVGFYTVLKEQKKNRIRQNKENKESRQNIRKKDKQKFVVDDS